MRHGEHANQVFTLAFHWNIEYRTAVCWYTYIYIAFHTDALENEGTTVGTSSCIDFFISEMYV